jgi:hypothetical protein
MGVNDDAEPHPDTLEELMYIADDPTNVYGSRAKEPKKWRNSGFLLPDLPTNCWA